MAQQPFRSPHHGVAGRPYLRLVSVVCARDFVAQRPISGGCGQQTMVAQAGEMALQAWAPGSAVVSKMTLAMGRVNELLSAGWSDTNSEVVALAGQQGEQHLTAAWAVELHQQH